VSTKRKVRIGGKSLRLGTNLKEQKGEQRACVQGWVATGETSTKALGFRQLQGFLLPPPAPTRHPRWRQARAVGGHPHAEGVVFRPKDTGSPGECEDHGGSKQSKGLKPPA
jgi:hypothetical protein